MAKQKQPNDRVLHDIYNLLFRHFGPLKWWPGDSPFEIAVGAILTQNTNWTNVEKAIANLKKENVLDVSSLDEMNSRRLASLIKPAGYFNVKTKRLKNFFTLLRGRYQGSMENMKAENVSGLREALLEVNGIGPETADSILLYALDKPIFVIDAYTKRVLQRHAVAQEEMTYHELQDLFHQNLKRDIRLFNEYHAQFVMLGKEYCKPKPRCEKCPLNGMRPILVP